MRRATIAVTPIDRPIAIAYSTVSNDSVSPTVATAFAPSLPTKNTSVTAKTLSSTISSTIGTASNIIARAMLPCV